MRPPHWYWGSYHWYPRWGWFFTGAVAGATLVYVATLPRDDGCTRVETADETLFLCDGVLYRPTYYRDQQVYEIVSEPNEVVELPPDIGAAPVPPAGAGTGFRLASPYMRGERIRQVQQALTDLGYDTGGVDGVFGRGTDAAVRAFQADAGLPVTGVVDRETLGSLGLQ